MARDLIQSWISLSPQDRKFCDGLVSHGDIIKAVSESGLEIDVFSNPESIGKKMMERQDIKDYLCVLGYGDSKNVEDMIERLTAMRREAWRRGDYKESKSIEMEIAKLRGWLIERIESKVENSSKMLVVDMTTEQLVEELRRLEEKKQLPSGVKLLPDGKLDIIEADFEEMPDGRTTS